MTLFTITQLAANYQPRRDETIRQMMKALNIPITLANAQACLVARSAYAKVLLQMLDPNQ